MPRYSHKTPGAIAPRAVVRPGKPIVSLMMAVMFSCATSLALAQDIVNIRQQERDVKVAIVFKLLRFVQWPADKLAEGDTLRLCVWPGESYTQTFREIEGSRVRSHVLAIEQLNTGNSASCHVLFSSAENKRSVAQWRTISGRDSILTISDVENFAAQGGMIHLMMRDQRVVFAVNPQSMENVELRMSALVLNLAEIQQSNHALPQVQARLESTNE